MDAFENIVAQYLEEENYWVRQSVKIELSKEEKRALNNFTMPRPEIDLVALNKKGNMLLLIEAKSFLDSPGVSFAAISGKDKKTARRYKLFTDGHLRNMIIKGLKRDFIKRGLINHDTKIGIALAAGKIHSGDEIKIKEYFESMGWTLFSPELIEEKIMGLADKGWEDNPVTLTAKLLKRGFAKRSDSNK